MGPEAFFCALSSGGLATTGKGRFVTDAAMLITGGRVIDPATGRDEIADVLIVDGMIAAVGHGHVAGRARTFDATGLIVAPGLVDLHVHLRIPGDGSKETMATGTAAAAAGGFTTICCMPNTTPPLDSPETLRDLNRIIEAEATVRVLPIATISVGRNGERAVDFAALAGAGAIGFSDDGDSCRNSVVMRAALDASTRLNLPVMVHCEDKDLAHGAMHEGDVSRALGLVGIPAEAEEISITRDLLIARLTGGWLHVLHVSTGYGADLVRSAKAEGIRVTAEVMPHHLTMSDTWVAGDRTLHNTNDAAGEPGLPADPNTKVNPPLRPVCDTVALLGALQDGTFDVVATDHAPHAAPEKTGSTFANASMGMSGLELALPTMLALVRAGHISLSGMIDKLSAAPARLLGLPLGTLKAGATADIVVFDPEERWRVTPESLKTKSPNTPLLGMELTGRTRLTLVAGEERYRA